jgi:nucleoside-diphosphate-sugar epimerase
MKVLLIGGSGTLGKFITTELAPRHEIIDAGKTQASFR